MINEQLLNFIKEQKNKGASKELISGELSANGWTVQDIEEGFKATDITLPKIPLPPYSNQSISDSGEQPKQKKSHMKKIVLFIILIAAIAWIGIELVNYFEYVSVKSKYNTSINTFDYKKNCDPNIPMPCGPRKPIYQLVALQKFYQIFPTLNPTPAGMVYKPVIYLYPTSTQEVKVQLDYQGEIFADYPKYNTEEKGWTVTAFPDGKIIDSDGKEYSYLFWEGVPSVKTNYDLSTGFIVKGEDTREFLQETLAKMGLTPKEYNEFIVFWYPKMKDNKYNLIKFAEEEYTKTAPLTITPKPDSILRVFMVYKPLETTINVNPQEIKSFNRTGFTVIEWGGTELAK